MAFTGYEFLFLFFVYSFLGWILEAVTTAVRHKHFANRGLINGPFCVIYGFAAVLITVNLSELSGVWLFLGSMILATLIEWTAGHLIEKLYHERWWDYSDMRRNLDGYIALPVSLFWGVLGFVCVRWANALLVNLFRLIPAFAGMLALWILSGMLLVDIAASLILMSGRSRRMMAWRAADEWLSGISTRLGRWIYRRVDNRIRRAYPQAVKAPEAKREGKVFAEGCDFYKIFLLFMIGAFLGDITETIFCRLTAGEWMSRSSVVWGPFSIVWGLGVAGVTALLYRYRNRSDSFLFCVGTLLGGVYEYVCSVFTEIVFGTVFWDYSQMPFNLGGRINLLFCFFWGIAAVVWFKLLYPPLSKMIERIPMRYGKIATWALVVFMAGNMLVSSLALTRYDQRSRGIEAEQGWQVTMDARFGDARMERIYPNALKVD
ncbi:MAG: putative ABC transporter permease [Roseburia sp.]|nr:putative ABC transporter permease [Roseburia sp.]